jgi:hypothetical protein
MSRGKQKPVPAGFLGIFWIRIHDMEIKGSNYVHARITGTQMPASVCPDHTENILSAKSSGMFKDLDCFLVCWQL